MRRVRRFPRFAGYLLMAALLVLVALPAPVLAQANPALAALEAPRPRPFGSGTLDLSGVIGFGAGQGGVAFTFGASVGYFVLPGLEPGLYTDMTVGSDRPTAFSLLPFLRWVFWRDFRFSPYLKAQGGWLFVVDHDDVNSIGGGGGVIIGMGRGFGVQLEGIVSRLFPERSCPSNGCTRFQLGVSIGFFFGGASPSPAVVAPPPPPPVAVPPPPPPMPLEEPTPPPASTPQAAAARH